MKNDMINKIIKKTGGLIAGKKRFQKIFESLNFISLIGMNIGGITNPNESGEKSAVDYVRAQLKPIDELVIFDIGANVGRYSALLKEAFGEKAIVFSFEPAKKTFQRLKSNLDNKTGVHFYNFGFGNENAKIILYADSDESGLASIYKRRLDHLNINLDAREEIEVKTLDSFCDEKKIKHIHFVKIDVEGNELMVLKGASKMIDAGAIDFIQFEFGGCNIDSRTYFQDFYYLLKDKYNIYRIVKDGLWPIKQYKEAYETFITTNYLAEKKHFLA